MSNTNESNELCKTFASLIYKDIRKFIEENQAEYKAWLEENQIEKEAS